MTQLPNNLYSAAQTRELDRIAIEEFDIAGTVLMERAGSAAYAALIRYWPQAKTLCVICGTGNNGGDGFVVARLAYEQEQHVEVLLVGDSKKIKGEALVAKQALEATGIKIQAYREQALGEADVIVDALFGTGLKGAMRGSVGIIKVINQHHAPVLALDIPSGLLADSGHALADAVKADVTFSFIGLNQGLFTAKGVDHCGEIIFDDLQIPHEVAVSCHVKRLQLPAPVFPKRLQNSHKGLFGHVLVIGGDVGMSGAALLACEAALRSGAGLVSLATRASHAALMSLQRPEIMSHPVENENEIKALIDKATVIAVGPGLGQSEWAQALFKAAVTSGKKLVIDADALNLLAAENSKNENAILTPHPGEAARLLATSTAEVQAERFAAIKNISDKYGGTIILKGAGSLTYSQGMIGVCDKGNAGMASGGMGDVLTGIVASLLAQGFSLSDAANTAVCLHAHAADIALDKWGEQSLLPSDLMPAIAQVIAKNKI